MSRFLAFATSITSASRGFIHLTRADEDEILIVDNTIAEKAGEKIEGVRSDSRALHEPPWYGTVRPVVWEVGGSDPATYPIRDTLS